MTGQLEHLFLILFDQIMKKQHKKISMFTIAHAFPFLNHG